MAPSSFLFCLLFSFFVAMLVEKVESQNTSFKIDTFTNNSQLLTYQSGAFVPPDEAYVRLIPVDGSGFPRKANVGRVLYTAPVQLWVLGGQASFETTIVLQMTPFIPDKVGEGMTFFVVPVNSTKSTGGGGGDNLGIYDAVEGGAPILAVEFDVGLAGQYDPPYKHIGINLNSQRSQNTTRVDDIMGERVTARITYDVPTRKINVVATYGASTKTVSYFCNLAALFPQQVQVGLSASTGAWVAYFDVYSWHFNSTMVRDRYNGTYIKRYVI